MINMELKGSISRIKNQIYPVRGTIHKIASLFGEETNKNWLKEEGVLGWKYKSSILKGGIVEHNMKFDTFHKCYSKIPKVFRAINMRAEFAIQGGFRLVGNESDVNSIRKWSRSIHLDTILLTIVRNMLVYGNCFVEMVGSGKNTKLHFLPVKQMRVIRGTKEIDGYTYYTHEVVGYAQVDESGLKVLNEWKGKDADNIIHFKWNWNGTDAYGISEIQPALINLTDKIDAEAVIPRILKFHADARIIYRCGPETAPYNDDNLSKFTGTIEGRVVGGDVAIAGDIVPVVIQPKSNPEITELLNHIEQQVDVCMNSPAVSLLTGNMDGQTSQTLMDSMERDVKTIQDFLFAPFEMQVFPRVIEKNESPEIVPKPMNIETFLRLSRTLRQLVGKKQERPILTINEARKEAGYGDIDESELEKIMSMEKNVPKYTEKEDEDEFGEEIQSDGQED